jgi:hypothetical protein
MGDMGLRIAEGIGHRAWSIGKYSRQLAVSLSVISYSLFGRYLAMKSLDNLNDFYAFYGFYDLTNSLIDK